MIERIRQFLGIEARSEPYTDTIVQMLLERATGEVLGIAAAEEMAAGLLGRSFAAAEVSGSDASMFPPDVMMTVARDLMLQGESLWRVGLPMEWHSSYDFQKNGNYLIDSIPVQAVNVFHPRYAMDRTTGRGVSPIDCVPRLRKYLRQVEQVLQQESTAKVGYVIPAPLSGVAQSDFIAKFQAAKGGAIMAESMAGGYGDRMNRPLGDYEQKRIGVETPLSVQNQYLEASKTALNVYGVPTSIVYPTDASSMREGWRIFLHSTIEPLAKIVVEAARRAEVRIGITFDALMASDIQGRARAFGSLVQGGMDVADAAVATGLLENEDA